MFRFSDFKNGYAFIARHNGLRNDDIRLIDMEKARDNTEKVYNALSRAFFFRHSSIKQVIPKHQIKKLLHITP
ncbi:MAG: hypothetical protein U5L09_03330 [Bacteroidales bacterium]|nr:hypothetical protein [Bacteroidales bacterium]